MNPNQLYLNLVDKLIENNYDTANVRSENNVSESTPTILLAAGTEIHSSVTNKKRNIGNGENSEAKYQGQCKICKKNPNSLAQGVLS